MTLTIIIPFYNSEKYFYRCLYSLFAQTLSEIEFIFINDASSDMSESILIKILEYFPNRKEKVKIIKNENNKGIAFCRKLGIQKATGEYLAFCDSDDYVELNMYQLLIEQIKESDADMITCGYFIEKDNTKTVKLKKYDPVPFNALKDIYGKCEIVLWDKLFKKEFLIKNKILPLEGYNYYEDCYMTIKALYFANKIVTIPNPLYHYVSNPNSSSKRCPHENLKSMNKYINELDFFLNEQETNSNIYKTLIHRLKFQYKLKFKEYSSINRKDWYNIYKETHSTIFKFIDIPFIGRLKLYFLINLGIY